MSGKTIQTKRTCVIRIKGLKSGSLSNLPKLDMKYSKLRFYQLILTAELALFLLLNSHCEAATKKMFSGIAEPEKVTASISDWRENVNVFGGKLLETRVLVDQTADVSGL